MPGLTRVYGSTPVLTASPRAAPHTQFPTLLEANRPRGSAPGIPAEIRPLNPSTSCNLLSSNSDVPLNFLALNSGNCFGSNLENNGLLNVAISGSERVYPADGLPNFAFPGGVNSLNNVLPRSDCLLHYNDLPDSMLVSKWGTTGSDGSQQAGNSNAMVVHGIEEAGKSVNAMVAHGIGEATSPLLNSSRMHRIGLSPDDTIHQKNRTAGSTPSVEIQA